jgi:hypothetical protein
MDTARKVLPPTPLEDNNQEGTVVSLNDAMEMETELDNSS